MDAQDLDEMKRRLNEMKVEHRDLDDVIDRLIEQAPFDQLQAEGSDPAAGKQHPAGHHGVAPIAQDVLAALYFTITLRRPFISSLPMSPPSPLILAALIALSASTCMFSTSISLAETLSE